MDNTIERPTATFIENSLKELEFIYDSLANFNERLHNLSVQTGFREYNKPENKPEETLKTPENHLESFECIIGMLNEKLRFIECRISELEKFI